MSETFASVHPAAYKTLHDAFRQYGIFEQHAKRSMLFREGEHPMGGYLLGKGFVRVFQSSEVGQEVTVYLRRTGDVFGMAEHFLGLDRRRSAQCLTSCEVWRLPGPLLNRMRIEYVEFGDAVLAAMSWGLLRMQETLEELTAESVPVRLALFFLQGRLLVTSPAVEVNMPLTHEDIAQAIGCSRQTVSALLSQWRKQGLIFYIGRSLAIPDPLRLLRHVTEESG